MKVRERLNAVLLHPFTLRITSETIHQDIYHSVPSSATSAPKTPVEGEQFAQCKVLSNIENESENQKTGAQAGAQFSSRVRILSILKVLRYHPRRTKSFKISL
jgi:hypothetical protein